MYAQLMSFFLMGAAAGAQTPTPAEGSKPPQISSELRARFWRAQAEATAAAARAKQAQDTAKAMQDEMQKTCGDRLDRKSVV